MILEGSHNHYKVEVQHKDCLFNLNSPQNIISLDTFGERVGYAAFESQVQAK